MTFTAPGAPPDVSIDVCVADGDRAALVLPNRWGGVDDLSARFADITVERPGRAGSSPPSAAPVGYVAAAAGPPGWVRFRYRVVADAAEQAASARYAAVVSSTFFAAAGTTFLARPVVLRADGSADAPLVTVTMEPPPGWTAAHTAVDLAAVQFATAADAGYLAGAVAFGEALDGSAAAQAWVVGEVGLDAGGVARLAAEVAAAQAELLAADDVRMTRVFVVPSPGGAAGVSGAGRAGGYVLEVGRGVRVGDPDLVLTAAHESLHRLIGHGVRFDADDADATAWFKEGVTDYAAARSAASAGLVPSTAFFARLGRAVEAVEVDARLPRSAYAVGTLAGLVMDLRLRAAGESLEDVLTELHSLVGSMPLTAHGLDAALRAIAPDAVGAVLDALAAGALPPYREALRDAGVEVVLRVAPAPWYGFAWGRGVGGAWEVARVDPASPAAAAGVFEGMQLAGEPEVAAVGRPGAAGGVAVLRARTDRGERRIVFEGEPGQRQMVALEGVRDSGDAYLRHFGLRTHGD